MLFVKELYHFYVEIKNQYKWVYIQNRIKLTDIKNSVMVTKREREGEEGYIRSKGLAKYKYKID